MASAESDIQLVFYSKSGTWVQVIFTPCRMYNIFYDTYIQYMLPLGSNYTLWRVGWVCNGLVCTKLVSKNYYQTMLSQSACTCTSILSQLLHYLLITPISTPYPYFYTIHVSTLYSYALSIVIYIYNTFPSLDL